MTCLHLIKNNFLYSQGDVTADNINNSCLETYLSDEMFHRMIQFIDATSWILIFKFSSWCIFFSIIFHRINILKLQNDGLFFFLNERWIKWWFWCLFLVLLIVSILFLLGMQPWEYNTQLCKNALSIIIVKIGEMAKSVRIPHSEHWWSQYTYEEYLQWDYFSRSLSGRMWIEESNMRKTDLQRDILRQNTW